VCCCTRDSISLEIATFSETDFELLEGYVLVTSSVLHLE
jgi:hypothetical protein